MNENRILVLVTYTSIASLLTLILMIVYGSINIDENNFSEWLAPSTIAENFSEQREYISKVFNARRDLFTAQKSVFLAINHLIELNGSLVHKR